MKTELSQRTLLYEENNSIWLVLDEEVGLFFLYQKKIKRWISLSSIEASLEVSRVGTEAST